MGTVKELLGKLKGVDINSLTKSVVKENEKEIRNAIMAISKEKEIYIKSFSGVWYANNGKKVDESIIPEFDYYLDNGESLTNEAGDREELTERFKVINVSFLDEEHIEIIFSEDLIHKSYIENIKLSGYLNVKDTSINGNRIIATLDDKLSAKAYEGVITISGNIRNINGESLGESLEEEIYVINKQELSNRVFDKNVSIISNGFKVENLTFNKGLTISGDNGSLKGVKADKLSINPGKTGKVLLEKVTADKMYVFSGGVNSLNIKDCDFTQLKVMVSGKITISDLGGNNVKYTFIESNTRLDSLNGAFEKIIIPLSSEAEKIELIGRFKQMIAENNVVVSLSRKSELEELIIKGHVKVDGIFGKIDVQNEDSSIEISDGTKINKLMVGENNLVTILGVIEVNEIEGPSGKVHEIEKEIKTVSNKVEKSLRITKNITVINKDIELKLTLIDSGSSYKRKKYKTGKFSIDTSNLTLTKKEQELGIPILVYAENNHLVNAIQLKVNSNKLEYNNLVIKSGKDGKIVLNTKQKGKIIFVFQQ